MNRIVSTLAYVGCTAAATIAAALMSSGTALAETPSIDPPFVSTMSRAEVRAELMRDRGQVTAAGGEWALQNNGQQHFASGLTRQQVVAEYIASRNQVQAITSEDSGSSYFAQARTRTPDNMMASHSAR